jgi:hypothetical protein
MHIEILITIKPAARAKRRLLIWANPNDSVRCRGCVHYLLDVVLSGLRIEGVDVLFDLSVKHRHR